MATSATRGMLPALSVWIGGSARYARSRPSAPPATASTRLSASICITSRRRPAPSAVRIATSFSRTDARTSSRFATFAHAISTTTPTAASSVRSAGRIAPTTCSCSATTSADSLALESGYCSASRSAMRLHLRVALRGDRRPASPGDHAEEMGAAARHWRDSSAIGRQYSAVARRKIEIRRHDADDRHGHAADGHRLDRSRWRSPPNRRCQSPWLRTITLFAFGLS